MYRISALAAGRDAGDRARAERSSTSTPSSPPVTDRTRLIFIANPANPTGTMLPLSEASSDLADAPAEQCLLVLDGAYAEFAEGYDGGARWSSARQRGDDAHLLQGLRARRAARRLGLWPARDHRRAQPHPRALQPVRVWRWPGAEAAVRDTDWVEPACASTPMSARG
jgi:histidinol-phosphate aminotransferase